PVYQGAERSIQSVQAAGPGPTRPAGCARYLRFVRARRALLVANAEADARSRGISCPLSVDCPADPAADLARVGRPVLSVPLAVAAGQEEARGPRAALSRVARGIATARRRDRIAGAEYC